MNASRFFGEPIISIGEVRPERLEGASAQVLANREGVYRKLVYHRGRLAGALLYGDISGAGIFYRLYRQANPRSATDARLWKSERAPGTMLQP